MHHTASTLARQLLPELDRLRQRALDLEHEHAADIAASHANFRDSARNLLHYLSLRQRDIRGLQTGLARLGLSRMARSEARVLDTLDAVRRAVRALADQPDATAAPAGATLVDMAYGENLLARHAEALLGRAPERRRGRIMVTLPSEAATRPELLAELLRAGMSVARINCAHDDGPVWLAMIAKLRAAERETGLTCRIHADLAGPKLRTGEIAPAGSLLELRVRRDALGRMAEPARVRIVARGAPPAAGGEPVLPVDDALFAAIRAGDELEAEDTREVLRHFVVRQRVDDGWLAESNRHAYLLEDTPCTLVRAGMGLMRGTIGPLPAIVPPLVLKAGDRLWLTPENVPGRPAEFDQAGLLVRPASIPCTLGAVFRAVKPGQSAWLDDGKLGGRVAAAAADKVEIEIVHAAPEGGKLRAGKGINLPDTEFDIPALTHEDLANLELLAPQLDSVGLSFVRSAADVLALRQALARLDAAHLGGVFKIETRQGFENLPSILLAAMRQPTVGIMLARGDLAVEIGFERLSEVQEEILRLCEAAHIPVIWATQVLESMVKRGLPSRAEVTDAAKSGQAECVMLNKGEHVAAATRFLGGVLERMAGHRHKSQPVFRRLAVSELAREVAD